MEELRIYNTKLRILISNPSPSTSQGDLAQVNLSLSQSLSLVVVVKIKGKVDKGLEVRGSLSKNNSCSLVY